MTKNVYSVTLDGPAGAGKSTVAKLVASKLDILCLDTGAMYRTIALCALNRGISPSNASMVEKMLNDVKVEVTYENGEQVIYLNGENIMGKIRTAEVSKAASDIAVIPAVRLAMVKIQRELAQSLSLVIDGRDIGTFVLPNAKYKFFVTADATERAKRRLKEQHAKGQDTEKTLETMAAEILARDLTDSTREFAPLKCPKDAVIIDTTDMTIDEVVQTIVSAIKEA